MTSAYIKLTGTIHTATALHLGTGSRTGVIKHSYSHIPGSFLRGSVGTTMIKAMCRLKAPLDDHTQCEHYRDCRYAKLFGEGSDYSSQIFFRYAYPLHLKCGGVYRPAPKTLYVCENSQCGNHVDTYDPPYKCGVCGGRMKPYKGYMCDNCGELERLPIRLGSVTSTAIDRKHGGAAIIRGSEKDAGTLHTLQVIPPGSRFRFEAVIGEKARENVELVRNVVEKGLPDEGLGGGRSRGLGKVIVEDLHVHEVSVEDLEERASEIDVHRFNVQACSPLILGGQMLPRTLLEGARRAYSWVYHEGKPSLPELSLVESRVKSMRVSGWSQKTSSRRRVVSGFSSGSMFQFTCEEGGEVLAKALSALEVYPLGDYKPHGCGQLCIWSQTEA